MLVTVLAVLSNQKRWGRRFILSLFSIFNFVVAVYILSIWRVAVLACRRFDLSSFRLVVVLTVLPSVDSDDICKRTSKFLNFTISIVDFWKNQ